MQNMIEKAAFIENSCPSWLLETPIAHRGYHSGNYESPENSLKAFSGAIQKGFAIELDVHLLADGKVAVFHDEDLGRMTGLKGKIEDCDSRKLTKLRLLGSDQGIPLLDDVLELVRGKVPLLIEIKNRGSAGKPENTLFNALEAYTGPYAVQSFNPKSINWFMNEAPDVTTGQVLGCCRVRNFFDNIKYLKNMLFNRTDQPGFFNYDIRWLPIIHKIRSISVPIIGWTARSAGEYRWARKWCSNIVFEGFDPFASKEALLA